MKELTLKALVENLPRVTEFIDEQLEGCDCPLKAQMQIDVAIDELFGNIAHYAYGEGTGEATVRFEYDASGRRAIIDFVDGGEPFNPLERDDPDVSLSAAERAVGGLGIFLVKKTMDEVRYRRQDGLNVLTIIKKF